MKLRILMVFLAFIAGMLASALLGGAGFSTPIYTDGFEMPTGLTTTPKLEMPSDRVREEQIGVYSNQVVIDIKNAEWSSFTPTKSMVPIIDSGANAIQVKPLPGCTDVEVGDIISYESKFADGVIIHRVVAKGNDENGLFFVAKGDSNPSDDPGRIRCDQILRVLVAIIY